MEVVVVMVVHLWQASLLGLGRHFAGVGLQHAAVLFAVLLVLRPGVALPQRPVHAHLQCLLQVPAATHTHALRTGCHTINVAEGKHFPSGYSRYYSKKKF